MEQPRDRDFLLVAAGQLADCLPRSAALDGQPLDPRRGCASSWREAARTARARGLRAATASGCRRRDSADGEAFVLAILAEHPDALLPALRAGDGRPDPRAHAHAPAAHGSRPKIDRSNRVRPAPSRPAMPKISPRCSVKVADIGPNASTSRMRSPSVARRARIEIVHVAADHQRHDLGCLSVGGRSSPRHGRRAGRRCGRRLL